MPDQNNLAPWPPVTRIFFRFGFVFITLFILTLSFPHPLIPDIPDWVSRIFIPLIKWTGDNVLNLDATYTPEIISDSAGLYIHLLLLFLIALIACFIWSVADRKKLAYHHLFYWFRVFISYNKPLSIMLI